MTFPLGKPILVMIGLALLTGAVALVRRSPPRADLELWLFADSHARMYRDPIQLDDGSIAPPLLDQFQRDTGRSARADLIAGQALDVRVMSLFMAGHGGEQAPDLVEVEIGSVGKYLRPPVDEIGFLPLNDYLEKSGWMNRIVKTRFTPWSKGPIIFGVPDDLHPSALTYRKDLFDQAGVELETATTWDEFQTRCLRFQDYWKSQGHPRFGIGLSTTSSDTLMALLQQRHVNLIDPDLTVHLTDERVVKTLAWYAQTVAGPKQIGTDFNPAPGQDVRDLAIGELCSMVTPDWRVGYIERYGPGTMGKLRIMPLPRFDPQDARTASWGGTMIGITRTCKHPDLAWKLIEKLYLDRGALIARQKVTKILPPIPEYWTDRVYHQPDPFFAGQKVDELFLSLADELPPRYVTAYTVIAQTVLSVVLNRAVSHVRGHGADGLEPACRQWLGTAEADLKDLIRFDQGGM